MCQTLCSALQTDQGVRPDPSGQDQKDATFPLQGDGVASALRGRAS